MVMKKKRMYPRIKMHLISKGCGCKVCKKVTKKTGGQADNQESYNENEAPEMPV